MTGAIVKKSKGFALAIHQDDAGTYRVIADGEVIIETGVLAAAEAYYDEELQKLSEESRARLAAERAHYDMQAVRSESFARRAANARKTGGRGGRGGV